ncbi:MAG: Co2+/Mg2+ efflux protein ApaG [Haliscomenobacter sp.]|nr:Co2+/Mg2+ efflux protein ApaG [Haliscomenobacter sp.]MBP9076977.1 Co2+/Mg2+ efflux protein ApaG [Haliscomenobacter sp.]MBP9872884.1 Co2+/Mg2+ efflux protein ApaG [Haliscomenobacter sp.]
METLTTNDIRVSVETAYQAHYSNPLENKFIFAYRITIENLGRQTVQLLRRRWIITESTGEAREVEGEGVIGRQPVLQPGESHQYVSWSHISTGLGKMAGAYQMIHSDSQEAFTAEIPEFQLVAPFLLN